MLGLGMGLHKHKQKQIVRNGLVLYLDGKDFSNSPPTSLWNDRSGLGNNATPSGMAYTTSSGSDGVGGVVFDGVNDNADCGTDISLKPLNAISCEINLIFTSFATSQRLFSDWHLNVYLDRWLFLTSGINELMFVVCNKNELTVTIVKASSLSLNVKYSFVGVYDGTNVKLYKDSVLISTLPLSGIMNASVNRKIKIGNQDETPGEFFNGVISSTKIYNRALTDSEIRQNYNASR